MTETGHPGSGRSNGNSRLVLAAFADGALLLDLDSGSFFRLNRSARCVAEGLVGGESVDQLGARLVEAFGISPVQAAADVQSVLRQLQSHPERSASNPLRFQTDGRGSLLCWDGVPACHIDHSTGLVTDAAPAEGCADATQRLLWAVPHVLMLQGYFVVHAAAIQTGKGVIGFAGPTGTGKTTLARLFAAHGSTLISEDLLVVALAATPPEVYTCSGAAIHQWVRTHGPQLQAEGRVATQDLAAVLRDARAALRELWFPQRVTAAPPAIAVAPMGKTDALALLLENSFAELALPDIWRHVWQGSRQLVEQIRVVRVEVPEGLELLAEAVADYSRTVKW
jgi:hypothetical protein